MYIYARLRSYREVQKKYALSGNLGVFTQLKSLASLLPVVGRGFPHPAVYAIIYIYADTGPGPGAYDDLRAEAHGPVPGVTIHCRTHLIDLYYL